MVSPNFGVHRTRMRCTDSNAIIYVGVYTEIGPLLHLNSPMEDYRNVKKTLSLASD